MTAKKLFKNMFRSLEFYNTPNLKEEKIFKPENFTEKVK